MLKPYELAITFPDDIDRATFLKLLANAIYAARLNSGGRLVDLTDVRTWLLQLSKAEETACQIRKQKTGSEGRPGVSGD